MAGIVEAVLDGANFPAKVQLAKKKKQADFLIDILLQVSAHWHKGTTFMVKFEEEVIARDRAAE